MHVCAFMYAYGLCVVHACVHVILICEYAHMCVITVYLCAHSYMHVYYIIMCMHAPVCLPICVYACVLMCMGLHVYLLMCFMLLSACLWV